VTVTAYLDLGAWALAKLKAASTVTALVMGGALQILEAGDITAAALEQVQIERRETAKTSKVLAVAVQDLGEENTVARFAVFVYDRYGYTNIRTVREAIISALVNEPAVLVRGALVIGVQYEGRSGHAIDVDFDLDLERIEFSGALVVERDCYT